MDVFDEARKKLKELRDEINPTIKKTFEEYGYVIKDFQTEKQLFKGEDSKGSMIRPAYTPFTIRVKKSKGQVYSRVTLNDTDKLYDTLKIIPKLDELEIIPTVEYAKELIKKYGNDIFGIQEELLKEFLDKYILPNLKNTFNDKLAKP